jgi:hypothetical protein
MRSRRPAGDAGMVTAELAVCLPVLVLLLSVALGAVSVGAAKIRVVDAAREAARVAARGGDPDAVDGVHLSISRSSTQVTVVASSTARLIGNALAPVEVTATAVAALEPSGVP